MWNTTHEPRYLEIPVRQLKSLLQKGEKDQAISQYCELTGAGYVEAEAVIEEIASGVKIEPPCKYVGWRTGGVPLFWCWTCKAPRTRDQVKTEKIDEALYDWEIVYVCSICKQGAREFHDGQAHRAFNLFNILLKSKGLDKSESWKSYGDFYGMLHGFADFKMSKQIALDFEQSLISGQAFFNFVTQYGYWDFPK